MSWFGSKPYVDTCDPQNTSVGVVLVSVFLWIKAVYECEEYKKNAHIEVNNEYNVSTFLSPMATTESL